MCQCITPQALFQGLARRVDNDGYEPTVGDLHAIAGAGCASSEMRAMVARMAAPTREKLHAVLQVAFPVERYHRG